MEFKKFQDLTTSTQTIMADCNLFFNKPRVFSLLSVTPVTIPLTKKKKNVDKKKLTGPREAILSVQLGPLMKGPDLRKRKKYWCPNCKLTKLRGNNKKEEKVCTVISELGPVNAKTLVEKGLPENYRDETLREIQYFCTNCKKYISRNRLGVILYFQNEVTIILSLGHSITNIMMFNSNLKIVNCKSDADGYDVVKILMKLLKPHTYTISKRHQHPIFVFRRVMKNVDFKIGFPISREKLNELMNDPKYKDIVDSSIYEPTGNANVNIKLYASKPKNFKYKTVTFCSTTASGEVWGECEKNLFKPKKKKKKKKTTMIVFSSSEVILTGAFDYNSNAAYDFFVNLVMTHKDYLKEQTMF